MQAGLVEQLEESEEILQLFFMPQVLFIVEGCGALKTGVRKFCVACLVVVPGARFVSLKKATYPS